jgi:lysophospholipase L1-like esterase
LGRNNKYASHIALATAENEQYINEDEAKLRSPFFMQTPKEKRENSKLFLYTGIHDGYTGSVPVSQTIDFYNKVVADWQTENTASKVPDEMREIMLRQQIISPFKTNEKIGDREVHYQNSFQDKIYLCIFEGTHEMLVNVGLQHVPSKKILALGDSNGAAENGWVNQLKKIRPNDFILNTSVSGNTIAFNNLNNLKLNTLGMLDSYLEQGNTNTGEFDAVIILLGTNDCKAIFHKQLKEVPKNLEKLIVQLRESKKLAENTRIIVVSPPPYGNDDLVIEKYKGGAKRVIYLKQEFEKVAQKMKAEFVDVHSALEPSFGVLSHDGVHLSEEGQKIIAKKIQNQLQKEQ